MSAIASPLNKKPIVLASASAVRRRLLANAGIDVEVVKADIDETIIRETLATDNQGIEHSDVAEILARAKADDVGLRRAGQVIIAADQILLFDGRIYEKPRDFDEARANLLAFSGEVHELHSAVVLAMEGQVVWSHVDMASVSVRRFSPEFAGRYLARVGAKALSSVGCYELEGLGLQLIERIEGDYFTVLGLPMFALLDELRRRDIIES